MMNRVRTGSLALLLALGCGGGLGNAGSGHPSLYLYWYSEDDGSSLVLEWYELEDALLYKVYTSEGFVDYTTGTSYTLTQEHACSWVAVAAVLPEGVVAETLNIADYVVKTEVSGWGEMDAGLGHPAGIGFAYGHAYDPRDTTSRRYLDVILDDGIQYQVVMEEASFHSPSSYSPPYNFRRNGFALWPKGSIVAPPPDSYRSVFPDSGGVAVGRSYAIWLNRGYGEWDHGDNFAMVKITRLSDNSLDATFYYQTIDGLRWVPTE